MTSLEASYAFCRKVARTQAKNFYYSFLLLPKTQRDAMCAVYAFMRHSDDLSDDPVVSGQGSLDHWRRDLDAALRGEFGVHGCWPALQDTVVRFRIPHEYFHQMIDGVSSDLEPRQVDTFAELYGYCYHVASVVGLAIIHIFGFTSEQAPALAEKCGVAFQLTNILRDVKEDAGRGRVYLPREDLERFGVDSVALATPTPEFFSMMKFQVQRARALYEESRPLLNMITPRNRASLWALMEIYRKLLDRIERSDYDVLRRRIRLAGWEKALIVLRAGASRMTGGAC